MSYILIIGAKSDIAKSTAREEDIYKAQQKGKNVLYTKWMWMMLIINMIPEWKFKGMSI